MRILLIAYDFPPNPSPQSLRWAYLVRELAMGGHEVHVLAPDAVGYGAGGLPDIPAEVVVHRVWPGPLAGFLAARQKKRRPAVWGDVVAGATSAPIDTVQLNWKGQFRQGIEERISRRFGHGLNWKGHAVNGVRALLSMAMFPDSRAEWMPWARGRLDGLLLEIHPDVVITSHEPATTIALGLRSKQRGFSWVADLGDPVLAPYTPKRWRKRAHALEKALCRNADIITVTSPLARELLNSRHGLDPGRCMLLTQGFDHQFNAPAAQADGLFDQDRLELLYTGSFYSFRRVGELLRVVTGMPSVRLSVATILPSWEIVEAARRFPDKVRLLGFVSHSQALELQRRCDVLVNLANDDPVQIPGKLYEYMGSNTPILSIGNPDDAVGKLVVVAGAGWCEPDDFAAISVRIAALSAQKTSTGNTMRPPGNGYDLMQHSWKRLSETLADAMRGIGGDRREGLSMPLSVADPYSH